MPKPLEIFKKALQLAIEQDTAFREAEAHDMVLDSEAVNDALAAAEIATDDDELQYAPSADE